MGVSTTAGNLVNGSNISTSSEATSTQINNYSTSSVTINTVTMAPATVGSIGNQVFTDVNSDGLYGAGDAPQVGVIIALYNASGVLIATTTTNASGTYLFSNLPLNANYSVAVLSGAVGTPLYQTGSNADNVSKNPLGYTVNLTNANPNNTTADFGYKASGSTSTTTSTSTATTTATTTVPTTTATTTGLLGSIGNQVFIDTNGDGVYNAGDGPIIGVQVNLYDALGVLVATTTTNFLGLYTFFGLPLGSYTVSIPSGQAALASLVNVLGVSGVDGNGQNPNGYAVNISTTSPNNMTADFAYKTPTNTITTTGGGSCVLGCVCTNTCLAPTSTVITTATTSSTTPIIEKVIQKIVNITKVKKVLSRTSSDAYINIIFAITIITTLAFILSKKRSYKK